jgi:hypothetical protein
MNTPRALLLAALTASCGSAHPATNPPPRPLDVEVVSDATDDTSADAPPACGAHLDRAETLEGQLAQGDAEGFTRMALDRELMAFRACATDCALLRARIDRERALGLRITPTAVQDVYLATCLAPPPDAGAPRCGFTAVESTHIASASNDALRATTLWPSGSFAVALFVEHGGDLNIARAGRVVTGPLMVRDGSEAWVYTFGAAGNLTSGFGFGTDSPDVTDAPELVVDRYGAMTAGVHVGPTLHLISRLEPGFPDPTSVWDRAGIGVMGNPGELPRLRAMTVAGEDLVVTAGHFAGTLVPAAADNPTLPTEGLVTWRHNGRLLLDGRYEVRGSRAMNLTDHLGRTRMAGDAQGFFLASTFTSGADLGTGPLTVSEGRSIVVAGFDLQSRTLWARTYGARDGNTLSDFTVGNDGSLVLSFACSGPLDAAGASLTPLGGSDLCALVLDRSGAVLRGVRVGSTADDEDLHAITRADGSLVLAGDVRGAVHLGEFDVPARGGLDVLFASIGADGRVRAACGAGSSGDDHATTITRSGDTVLLGGDFTGTIELPDATYTAAGGSDVFLLRTR